MRPYRVPVRLGTCYALYPVSTGFQSRAMSHESKVASRQACDLCRGVMLRIGAALEISLQRCEFNISHEPEWIYRKYLGFERPAALHGQIRGLFDRSILVHEIQRCENTYFSPKCCTLSEHNTTFKKFSQTSKVPKVGKVEAKVQLTSVESWQCKLMIHVNGLIH